MSKHLSHQQIQRYSRHLLIPEIGLEGQAKLQAASVLIVGTGGLGSPVALYLAAAGVGRLGLVDGDVIALSNLQRQIIHDQTRLGTSKVASASQRINDLNADVRVDCYDENFTVENAMQIAAPYDFIVDCSDNFATRYLTNDVCVLTGKPNIFGSIHHFHGQASVFYAQEGPCYRCLFPRPPAPQPSPGVASMVPGTIGSIQASEALKMILGIGEPLFGRLLLYDALEMSFETVQLRANPHCKVCGDDPEITALSDLDDYRIEPVDELDADQRISPLDLKARLEAGESLRLIDVRAAHELNISRIERADSIPLENFSTQLDHLEHDEQIVMISRAGVAARQALERLAAKGFSHVRVLEGGINAWARQVDPSLPVY